MSRVVVVGAGVVGLSVAVELLRAGHRVDVVARDLPRESSSAVGPGLWWPPAGSADPRVAGWAEETRVALVALSEQEHSPVRLLAGSAGGVESVAPVVDVPAYLDLLVRDLVDLGGSLTRLQLAALPTGADVVVSCTGLGARHFGADPAVTPVREQVVLVEQTGLEWWWTAGPADRSTYVVPGRDAVVVGAALEPGEWDRTVRPERTAEVLARATRAVPALAGARVLGARVGLWPARPEVRLERLGDVVHCHGHGAAGLTLSRGCAAEIAHLLA